MFYKYIPKVLSSGECDDFIELAENIGFDKATVDYYGENQKIDAIRNNSRVQFNDEILSIKLERKLQKVLEKQFPFEYDKFSYSHVGKHFRIYKYQIGEYFKPHKDGHVLEKEKESHITVLFYLNDTIGGETVLMPDGYGKDKKEILFTPQKGDVLLFEHGIWHEGRPVTEGNKYVLRTDLFYDFK